MRRFIKSARQMFDRTLTALLRPRVAKIFDQLTEDIPDAEKPASKSPLPKIGTRYESSDLRMLDQARDKGQIH